MSISGYLESPIGAELSSLSLRELVIRVRYLHDNQNTICRSIISGSTHSLTTLVLEHVDDSNTHHIAVLRLLDFAGPYVKNLRFAYHGRREFFLPMFQHFHILESLHFDVGKILVVVKVLENVPNPSLRRLYLANAAGDPSGLQRDEIDPVEPSSQVLESIDQLLKLDQLANLKQLTLQNIFKDDKLYAEDDSVYEHWLSGWRRDWPGVEIVYDESEVVY